MFYAPGVDGQCCFVVRCGAFEVQYSNDKKGFGVRAVNDAMQTMKKKDAMKAINYEKFVNQVVLTTKKKSIEEYLGLMACYMPMLLES